MFSFTKLAVITAASLVAFVAGLPTDPLVQSDVAGGQVTTHDSFPHFAVAISMNGTQWCGGTLLNANTVITAAHCTGDFIAPEASWFHVRAGSMAWNSDGVQAGVSRFITHPGYTWSKTQYLNDIAVWHLASPIQQSPNISYAKLPSKGFSPPVGANVIAAGWGNTHFSDEDGPKYLRQVTYPIIPQDTCKKFFTPMPVDQGMFCARAPKGGRAVCLGDSGGPVIDAKDKTLWGVVSWGGHAGQCDAPDQTDVFVRVSMYLDFINQYK